MEKEFEIGEYMLEGEYNKCMVCLKKFKLKEKIVLVGLQKPKGNYYINSVAIPIHTECHYKDKEE